MPTGIYLRTEEHNKKVGLASKRRWQDPEYLKKMEERNKMLSKLFKNRVFSEEHKLKISSAKIGKSWGKHTEQSKAKIKKAKLKQWGDEGERKERFKRRKQKENLLYSQKYPEKRKAQRRANYVLQISENRLCEICNERQAVHRHHEDYSKHLEVKFVCIPCHNELHRRTPFLKN